jgi:hypothetical protein
VSLTPLRHRLCRTNLQIRSHIRKGFNPWIWDPDGIVWWKKKQRKSRKTNKISWHCPFHQLCRGRTTESVPLETLPQIISCLLSFKRLTENGPAFSAWQIVVKKLKYFIVTFILTQPHASSLLFFEMFFFKEISWKLAILVKNNFKMYRRSLGYHYFIAITSKWH